MTAPYSQSSVGPSHPCRSEPPQQTASQKTLGPLRAAHKLPEYSIKNNPTRARFGSGPAACALTPEIGVTNRIHTCPGGIWASDPAANTCTKGQAGLFRRPTIWGGVPILGTNSKIGQCTDIFNKTTKTTNAQKNKGISQTRLTNSDHEGVRVRRSASYTSPACRTTSRCGFSIIRLGNAVALTASLDASLQNLSVFACARAHVHDT